MDAHSSQTLIKGAAGIPQHINDCPDDQYLNKYVREKVCAAGKWRDLGIVLMGEETVPCLDIIRLNHPNDIEECCSRMFNKWRQRNPKANWKQLMEALKEVKLTRLASELEELLMPSVECCAGNENNDISLNNNQQQFEKQLLHLGVSELEKCKDDLKQSYRKRINQKKSTRWPKLGNPTLYVDVTIVRAKVLPKRFHEEHAMGLVERSNYPYITVDELLKDGDKKVILIEGDPGAGKTTFTFQICKEWAEDKLLINDVVFWIPLRHYKSVTTPSELFDKLGYPEMMGYAQQNYGKGLVLILDGWDELPNHLQEASLFRDIIFNTIRVFIHSAIIVTSRPTCSGEIAEAVEETNSYYQILGFDQERAMAYIKAYFHEDPSCAELLITFLHNNVYLCQHFYIPITVVIMCFVYRSDGKQIPLTLSKLYERFIVLCLRSNVPDACVQDLAQFKTIHNIPKKMWPVFHSLCKMAFDMLIDNKLMFAEEELEVIQGDLNSLQLKQFDGFGLLHVDHYTSELATMETSYSFIHRAVQEILTAIFILDTGNISDIIDEYFYKGSYLINVFPFLFGLLSKELLRPLAGKLIQIFKKSDRTNNVLSSILYCLFEAHDETLCYDFAEVFNVKRDIGLLLKTLLEVHYVCYFIAVCGLNRLNVTMYFSVSGDFCWEILYRYLHNTSSDRIASICLFGLPVQSHKNMELFAKALSTQHNILSVKLVSISSSGCVAILCNSICKYNSHIINLRLPHCALNDNDLESIGSLLTTCLFLESLCMDCYFSEGVCLDLSMSFCEALCKTKSLQKFLMPDWSLSQDDSKVFGNMISQNCSLKELYICVAAADCLDPILNGLSCNTSIRTFKAWPEKISSSITLGQCLEKCLTLNHSLNIVDFSSNKLFIGHAHFKGSYEHVSWSSTQVSSICTGLCANTAVVTLDISGCYIDIEACHAICGMLSQNTTLQHLFLNPVHLEKQEAIVMIDSCRANATLKLLSLVQLPSKRWSDNEGKNPFQYSHDQQITHVLQQIQKLRQEKDKPLLNVYWEWDEYEKVKE